MFMARTKPQLEARWPTRPAASQRLGFNTDLMDTRMVGLAAECGVSVLRHADGDWGDYQDGTTGAWTIPGPTPKAEAEGTKVPLNKALEACRSHGITPVLIACYGAPYGAPVVRTLAAPAKKGEYTLTLNEPVTVHWPATLVQGLQGYDVTARPSNGGSLVVSASGSTVTLAAAMSHPELQAGAQLVFRNALYPAPADRTVTDPSRLAYRALVAYQAQLLGEYANGGFVCLWNEPGGTEQKDFWLNLPDAYDTPPKGLSSGGMHTLMAPLFGYEFYEGLELISGATDVTGGEQGLLKQYQPEATGNQGSNYIQQPPPAALAQFGGEGEHLYGNNPENCAWITLPAGETVYVNPNDDSSRFLPVYQQHQHGLKEGYALNVYATECGGTAAKGEERQARYLLRRALSLFSMGVPMCCFYNLSPQGPFSVAHEETDGTIRTRQAFAAVKRLGALLKACGSPAAPGVAPPELGEATGARWPVETGAFDGATGAFSWVCQRDYALPHAEKAEDPEGWYTLPTPPSATIAVSGAKAAVNLTSGASVPITDGKIAFTNDPVALIA